MIIDIDISVTLEYFMDKKMLQYVMTDQLGQCISNNQDLAALVGDAMV
jgi:hypothetical protein